VRRIVIAVLATPVLSLGVLAVEVQLARHGPDLPDDTPLDHDGRVGPPGDPLRVLWLGDSTAAGVGASDADHAMPRRVAVALDRPVEITSRAVSGDRVADVVARQLDGIAATDPDVVLISIGANDVTHLTSRDDFRSTYERLVDRLPERALVVILGVPDMGAPDRYLQPLRSIAGLRGRQLDDVSRAVARDHGAVYVDIAGQTGPTMRSDRRRYFAVDRFHPSDDGYALWADAVLDELRPALADRAKGADRARR
jgi:lysophospholipase L1-like esterase